MGVKYFSVRVKKHESNLPTNICTTQCKSSAEKPGPKVEKPGSRRREVSEFLEPTSHSEVYFHGPGLVRPHDLEFYRC